MSGIVVAIAALLGLGIIVLVPGLAIGISLFKSKGLFKELSHTGALNGVGGPGDDVVDAALMDFIDEWSRTFKGGRQDLIDAFDGMQATRSRTVIKASSDCFVG